MAKGTGAGNQAAAQENAAEWQVMRSPRARASMIMESEDYNMSNIVGKPL